MVVARKTFQLWQCVRDQTENREDTPHPPPTLFFMFTIFGIPDIERRRGGGGGVFSYHCRCSPVPRGRVVSRACTSVWLGTGFSHGWVSCAAVFCRCG